jgi:putative flippase GtrA
MSWVEAPHASGSSVGLNAPIRKLGRSQLVRFGLVGASGYVINLAVYTASLTLAGVHYELAAFLAFSAAVGNNYVLNRRWTFARTGRAVPHEAARFLAVSFVGFALNASVLWLFVESGAEKVPAQVLAVLAAAIANFVLNRTWTFAPTQRRSAD